MRISDWSSDVCSSDLLPMPFRKILPDEAEFEFGLILVEPQQIPDQLRRTRRSRHARLPREVKGPQHDARRIRRQLLAKDTKRRLVGPAIEHAKSCLASPGQNVLPRADKQVQTEPDRKSTRLK